MRWIVALAVVVASFAPMAAQAQECDGVTVTREDDGINCFPPVMPDDHYDTTTYDDTGTLALGEIAGTDDDGQPANYGLCVGCMAVQVRSSAPVRLEVNEFDGDGNHTHSYRRTMRPGAAYVMRQDTTTVIVKATALNGKRVDFEPTFYSVR